MSKIKINATKSSVQLSADGNAALIIGTAMAVGGLLAAIHYFPIWIAP
jgi:hypothetical protein